MSKLEKGPGNLSADLDPAKPKIEIIEKNETGTRYKVNAPEKPYSGEVVVNGVEISVRWDDNYKDYIIYFPQIELDSAAANEKEVYDQIIRISRDPEIAKQVFEYAKKIAQEDSDVYGVYKKVGNFNRSLSDDEE